MFWHSDLLYDIAEQKAMIMIFVFLLVVMGVGVWLFGQMVVHFVKLMSNSKK